MGHLLILILGALVTISGVVMVYDARIITSRVFGFGDQNEASLGLKMIGFVIAIIGAVIIMVN